MGIEVKALARMSLAHKALLVRMGGASADYLQAKASFRLHLNLPRNSLLECFDALSWLGELFVVATNRPRSQPQLRTARFSRKVRFVPASLYLLGIHPFFLYQIMLFIGAGWGFGGSSTSCGICAKRF